MRKIENESDFIEIVKEKAINISELLHISCDKDISIQENTATDYTALFMVMKAIFETSDRIDFEKCIKEMTEEMCKELQSMIDKYK